MRHQSRRHCAQPAVLRSLVLGVALLLPACAGSLDSRLATADSVARGGGLTPIVFDTGPFVLSGYWRQPETVDKTETAPFLTVYLEGDGLAFRRKRPTEDPTPVNPTALRLAALDPHTPVLYLARPCQYTMANTWRRCDVTYWSSHRFAPEVIAATGRALDVAKRETGAAGLVLIGYSGGGVVAALLAAQRQDVRAFGTVASPLDLDAWVRHHRVTPLDGSLNPIRYAERLQSVPQRHFVGSDDDIVPGHVVRSFAGRMQRGLESVVPVHGADHDCCWEDAWPTLRDQIPPL